MCTRSNELETFRPLVSHRGMVLLLTLTAVLGGIQASLLHVNGDAAWYLYMAGRVLDGAEPYKEIVDTNPPLIIWINEGIVALARAVGVAPIQIFPALLFFLAGLSLGLTWRTSSGLPLCVRQSAVLTWAYLFVVHAGGMAGQREHLLLMLILPYAYSAVAELSGSRMTFWVACVTGVAAGVGFALKPFFVPAMVGVEILLVARRGWRSLVRPQALCMGGVIAAYGIAILAITPEYLAVARRFAPLYPHHMPSGPMLASSSWRMGLVVVAIVSAVAIGRRRIPGWAEVFGVLALGLAGAVYLTGKGWRYHWLPAVSLSASLLSGCAGLVLARRLAGRSFWKVETCLAIGMSIFATLSIVDGVFERRGDTDASALVRRYVRAGDGILVLSCWVHESFPMINEAQATWGMRHPMVWQAAAFYVGEPWVQDGYHSLATMSHAERRFVSEVAEDFDRYRPKLLLVHKDPPTPAVPGFDYLAYFSSDPRFGRVLADYAYEANTAYFRIYRRRDDSSVEREALKSDLRDSRSTEQSIHPSHLLQSRRTQQARRHSGGRPDVSPSGTVAPSTQPSPTAGHGPRREPVPPRLPVARRDDGELSRRDRALLYDM